MSVWNLIMSGGWVMIPLLVCSILVWGVCVERFLAFRKWREKNREFLLSFSNHWLRSDLDGARKLCEQSKAEIASLAKELLDGPKEADRILARVDRKRQEQSVELRKFLWLLGTIGSAAPFIGLLGTVVGIIHAFHSIAESGSGGFTVVASGISEALVATAAGIVVAVIAVFFYNYFQVKVGHLQFQLKIFAEEILDLVSAKGSS